MDASERSAFGEMLIRYRVAAGLSQEALAERAGMSARGISDLERGVRRAPYRDTVTRLAAALELNERERTELEQAIRRLRGMARQHAAAGVAAELFWRTALLTL